MKPCRKMKKTLRTNALLRGWAQQEVLLRRLPRSTLPAAWKGLCWRQLPSGKSGLPSCRSHPWPSLPQGWLSFLCWGPSPCPPHSSLPAPPHPPPRPQEQLPMNLLLQAYPHPQVPFLWNNLKQGWSHFCFKIHSYIYTQENAGKNTLRH